MIRAILSHLRNDYATEITWEEMLSISRTEWTQVSEGCKGIRVRMPAPKIMSFIIKMEPGSHIPNHWHEKVKEYFTLLEGDCFSNIYRDMETGTAYKVHPGVEHNFSTENGCLLQMTAVRVGK